MLQAKRISVIGAGNMAEALVKGLVGSGKVRPDDLCRVNRAFFQVNGVISVGLLLLVLLQLAVNR